MVSSPRFNRIFSYAVLVIAILCLVGASYFFKESRHETIFIFFGLGLVIGGMVMAWGAFRTLSESDKKERIEHRVNRQLKRQDKSSRDGFYALDDSDARILAMWKFSKAEWEKRISILTRKNKRMEIVVSIGIFIVSGMTIFGGMEPGILIAGAFVAILFYFIRTRSVQKNYKLTGTNAEVIFTDQFIRMNERFIHFKNGTHFLKDIEVYHEPIDYILLVIAWPTGRGFDNSMDLRIPVPDEEKENLPMLLQQLEMVKKSKTSKSLFQL